MVDFDGAIQSYRRNTPAARSDASQQDLLLHLEAQQLASFPEDENIEDNRRA
jgi:hypothetical protein